MTRVSFDDLPPRRTRLGRRRFVASLLAPIAALTLPGVAAGARRGSATSAHVAILIDDDHPDAGALRLGTRLGAEEAEHTAALLRRSLTIADADAAADAWIDSGVRVVIAGVAAARVPALARAGAAADAIVLNIGSDADGLRGRDCAASLFHVAASERMRADAVATWSAGAGPAADVAAVEWHADLSRFGAEQLNDRCAERFGVAMNESAWLGWMAVKIAAESLFRARGEDAAALRSFLLAERTRFDGHKGQPLTFRPWDQQLRQPLYVVSGGRVLAELPDTRAPELPQSLDDYGVSAAETRCALHDGGREGRPR